jgi:hypothetical protein
MPNFKYGVQLPDQDHLSFNAVVFATAEEAETGGRELLSRWFVPIAYEVIETEDEVNYRVVNNRIQRLEQPPEEEPINQLLDMTDRITDNGKVIWTRGHDKLEG